MMVLILCAPNPIGKRMELWVELKVSLVHLVVTMKTLRTMLMGVASTVLVVYPD
jgi:hypothetical protein